MWALLVLQVFETGCVEKGQWQHANKYLNIATLGSISGLHTLKRLFV